MSEDEHEQGHDGEDADDGPDNPATVCRHWLLLLVVVGGGYEPIDAGQTTVTWVYRTRIVLGIVIEAISTDSFSSMSSMTQPW